MTTGVGYAAIAASDCSGNGIERNFAHQFDTGGVDRLYVRGLDNVHKKFLLQAAACNLALLMRSLYGAGKPRAAHEGVIELFFAFLALMKAFDALWGPNPRISAISIDC